MAREQATAEVAARHVLKSDVPRKMAKASLPEIRKADLDAEWLERIGGAIRQTRGALSLKEFAAAIHRDERTVARWEQGKERPQIDAILAVPELHVPLFEALARLFRGLDIVTTFSIRRSA